MTTPPDIEPNLLESLLGQSIAIEMCISMKLHMQAMQLAYSGIDIAGSLERKAGESTRDSFVRWADSYMLKARFAPCTGIELYGARCGMLHAMVAESELSRTKGVRMIFYATGDADARSLEKLIGAAHSHKYTVADVGSLAEMFRLGLADYFDEVRLDPGRVALVNERAKAWFGFLPGEAIRSMVD